MGKDYLDELKKKPYPLFIVPKPYSFDLNEEMINILRQEFDAVKVAAKFAQVLSSENPVDIEARGRAYFEEYGRSWMRRTMQLGEEYSDRTVEVIKEAVDRQGNQFMVWPHIPQRFIEIAYLSTQQFLKVPIKVNNQYELGYQIPKCFLFNNIKEKSGAEVANRMLCQHACLAALGILRQDLDLDVAISMPKVTAKDNYCEFSMKKLYGSTYLR